MRKMLFFLKSRKARVWLAVFMFAVLSAVFLLVPSAPAQKPAAPSILARGDEERLALLSRDDDGDGLKNWEEALFRADPHSPDTDGDGVSDGEEVKQGRDPAKAGPGDRLPEPLFAQKQTEAQERNLTRDFTEAMLGRPVVTLLSGGTPQIPQEAADRYADLLLKKSVLSAAPAFSRADVVAHKQETPEAVALYFQSFQNAFEKIKSGGADETAIALDLLQSGQTSERFEDLEAQAALYDDAIADLKKTTVPQSLADFHVSTLNYLSRFRYAAALFRQFEQDPVKALVALNERLELEKRFREHLTQSQERIIAAISATK